MSCSFADPSGRALWGVGFRPSACWDCECESHRVHGCLSFVNVVFGQIEASVTDWSLVQRSPTDCGVSKCTWSWNLKNEDTMGIFNHNRKYKFCSFTRVVQGTLGSVVVVRGCCIRWWSYVVYGGGKAYNLEGGIMKVSRNMCMGGAWAWVRADVVIGNLGNEWFPPWRWVICKEKGCHHGDG
jgi:hypothetical protein